MEWEKEFNTKFISPKTMWVQNKEGKWYGKEDVKEFISTQIEKAKQEEREKIQKLIVDEMLICHKEGTPTSRLTSLFCLLKILDNKKKTVIL